MSKKLEYFLISLGIVSILYAVYEVVINKADFTEALGGIVIGVSLIGAILDTEEKIELNLPSRTTKINVSNEFLKTLDEEHITYKLN